MVFMFSMTDMDKVMNASWPAVELLYQVTRSEAVTVALTVLLIVIYACKLFFSGSIRSTQIDSDESLRKQPTSLPNGLLVADLRGLSLVTMVLHFRNTFLMSTPNWSSRCERPLLLVSSAVSMA
jgi:hypothetical protein